MRGLHLNPQGDYFNLPQRSLLSCTRIEKRVKEKVKYFDTKETAQYHWVAPSNTEIQGCNVRHIMT